MVLGFLSLGWWFGRVVGSFWWTFVVVDACTVLKGVLLLVFEDALSFYLDHLPDFISHL